jgi:hypothetical protein
MRARAPKRPRPKPLADPAEPPKALLATGKVEVENGLWSSTKKPPAQPVGVAQRPVLPNTVIPKGATHWCELLPGTVLASSLASIVGLTPEAGIFSEAAVADPAAWLGADEVAIAGFSVAPRTEDETVGRSVVAGASVACKTGRDAPSPTATEGSNSGADTEASAGSKAVAVPSSDPLVGESAGIPPPTGA